MSTAMVWGASGGIGTAFVRELVERGWHVIAISRSDADSDHPNVTHIVADAADSFSVRSAILQAAQTAVGVDLFIYTAGVIRTGRVGDQEEAAWNEVMQANLTGAFISTKYSLPLLADSAAMVYVGAISENLKLPGFAAYAASKSGLEAFVASLAKEERGKSILLVRPGAVDTPFWKNVPAKLPKTAIAPTELAKRVLDAVASGQTGALDIR